MGFRDHQSTYELKYAAEHAKKVAEKLGYTVEHAVRNFLDFAEIMTDFQMSPTETFDRWLQMSEICLNAPAGKFLLKPYNVQETTAESTGS